MTPCIFKPRLYTPREVALMIEIRLHYAPDLPAVVGTDRVAMELMAAELKQPSPEVLKHLELEPHEGGFIWQPR